LELLLFCAETLAVIKQTRIERMTERIGSFPSF